MLFVAQDRRPVLPPAPPLHTAPPLVLAQFVAIGPPQGARRHRAARRGDRIATFHEPAHLEAEERIRVVAASVWQGRPAYDLPVRLEVMTWHRRPARMKRKRDRDGSTPVYTGKPDADNIAKLVMDALTRAGVWRDDTLVADLIVRRRYLALGATGDEVGLERTEVVLWTC